MKKFFLFGLSVILAGSVQAAMIGLNFVGGRFGAPTVGSGAGGTNGEIVLAADSAGVVPQTNWNNGFGSNSANSGGAIGLVDDSGSATGASASWSGVPNSWTQSGATATDGNERLMNGYLDTNNSGGFTTISIAGVPYATYDVIIYKDGDAGGGRSGDYTVNGVVQTDLREGPNFPIGAPPGDGTFTQAVTGAAGNFALFTGLSGAALTILADESASGGGQRAPINGIQIIDTTIAVGGVPEPSTVLQFAVVLGGIWFARRRRTVRS